jgi:MFS family permease
MVFLINLPVGIAGLLLALRFVPESRSPNAVKLDWLGVLLIGAASLALIYPLVQGREEGWPAWAFGLMALGVVLLGLFALVERSGRGTPLIEPSLLRNGAFRGGLLFGIVFFAGFTGMMLVFSVFLQLGLGFSPEHTGLTFAPMSLGAAIGAGGSYPLMAKFGRHVLHTGLVLGVAAMVAVALVIGAQGTDTTSWQLAAPLLVYGIGMGFVFGPFFNVVLAGVDEHEVGSASGTLTAIQQLGGSAGIAVLATIFFSYLDDGTASPDAAKWTMLVAAALLAASALVAFLLPREARMDEVH